MDVGTYREIAHSRNGRRIGVNTGIFASAEQSHEHSLATLEALYQYDDFMGSIGSMVDLGCGSGLDLEWWATRTTRDLAATPLNIRCVGVDLREELPMAHRYRNITYQRQDFETETLHLPRQQPFDIMWCHDSFQFVQDPFQTLRRWRQCLSENGALIITVAQTTNIETRFQQFDQRDFCYHNWTMVSLIHVLAVSGFDCHDGYFLKNPDDPWLHAMVYRSPVEPQDPRRTSWYQLMEQGLLPDSMCAGIQRNGYARQRDLVLRWLDRSSMSFAKH